MTLNPKPVAVILLAIFATAGAPSSVRAADEGWSQESNGLRGRLAMRRSHVTNGTGIVAIYLELANVSDVGNPMLVTADRKSMTFRLIDADGRDVPQAQAAFNGRDFGALDLVLPFDSSIRYRIGPCGMGIPGDKAALVDLGTNFGWVLPKDGKAYYLQGVLKIEKPKELDRDGKQRWHGVLELPRVRVPTEAEPIDPAMLGPRIDELGRKMLDKDSRVAEAAERELSLIDDPRAIPWYVKAVQTPDYSMKFHALDRLSRFKGDEAFEALKIGMATRDEDLKRSPDERVHPGIADNIRHQAAICLARSPHAQAKGLLLTMENDAASAVRITVVQAAANMTTIESTAVLQRRQSKDADERVRTEAARLLKTRTERRGREVN